MMLNFDRTSTLSSTLQPEFDSDVYVKLTKDGAQSSLSNCKKGTAEKEVFTTI